MFTLEKGQHRFTQVFVDDEPGAGGAHHVYSISKVPDCPEEKLGQWPVPVFSRVKFQTGPVKENGVNGIFMEDLLQVCTHRLECFQAGPFACQSNAEALGHINQALAALNKRTADRQQRNVEGTNQL